MDTVEEVKSRLAIEDVISEYVHLKRAGRNFRGLSPWTDEKTPSFMVSPEKQIWHDFSSGRGGNVFSFVMEMEGLDFKAALELLARKAGVDLEQYRSSPDNTKLKQRLYEANKQAARFYQMQFKNSQKARDYAIKKRGMNKQTLLDFQVGYSPSAGDSLKKFLVNKKFSVRELEQAGLIARSGQRNDMFRDRLMIPLMDGQGQVVGFTARLLADNNNAPKYINTASTLLYDKSRHIFGLHLAKEAMRRAKFTVLVEGNLDVIASHQAGIKNVVATAGTALTQQHLKAVGRFSDDVRLCFDADKAGLAATERAIPIASKTGVSLSVITLPKGKDPDDLIKGDPKIWEDSLSRNKYAFDWLIEHVSSDLDIKSAEGKKRLSDTILPLIRQLDDKVEQDHYVIKLSDLMGVSHEAMRAKLSSSQEPAKRLKSVKTAIQLNEGEAEARKVEGHLLALLLTQPALRFYQRILSADMFISDQARKIFEFLKNNENFSGQPSEVDALRQEAEYVKILGLQYEELYQGLELLELRNEAARLQARVIEHYVKSKKRELIEEIQSAGEEKHAKLLVRARELDQLLKNVKG